MFEWNFPSLMANKANESPWFKSRKDYVYVGGAGFPCQKFCTNSSSLNWFTEKLLYRCHEPVECMNVEFARHAVKFSYTFSDFVDLRCRERSGILLRGPDRKKTDRLAANQSTRFTRIPDRKKIIFCYWSDYNTEEQVASFYRYSSEYYSWSQYDMYSWTLLGRTWLSRTPRYLEQNRISLGFALVFRVIYYGLHVSRTPRYLELFPSPLGSN